MSWRSEAEDAYERGGIEAVKPLFGEALYDHPDLTEPQRQAVRDFEVYPGEGWLEGGKLVIRDANGGLFAIGGRGEHHGGSS